MIAAANSALRRVPVWLVYLAGAMPALWLVWAAVQNDLGPDPVATLEHRLGKIGLQFLIAGLAVTPLRRLAGLNLLKFRRAIGLLAFGYVVLHFTVWLVLDLALIWGQALPEMIRRPYLLLGLVALILLVPLAVTSNNASVRQLGAARWRRLHLLTYPAVVLGATHYALQTKTWQVEALIYLGIAGALPLLRLLRR